MQVSQMSQTYLFWEINQVYPCSSVMSQLVILGSRPCYEAAKYLTRVPDTWAHREHSIPFAETQLNVTKLAGDNSAALLPVARWVVGVFFFKTVISSPWSEVFYLLPFRVKVTFSPEQLVWSVC